MKYLKLLLGLLLIPIILSWKTNNSDCTNSIYLLEQVHKEYDAGDCWSESELKIHIQEPRIGNPNRYTKLLLNNSSDYFEMERKRDVGIIKRIITEQEESKIFLDGNSEISEEIKENYALNLERTKRSKNFYKIMYGLPMSITDEFWKKIEPAQKAEYEGQEVYRIGMELNDQLISKHWTLITSVETSKILAIEFNHPDEPENEGEIIKFYGEYEFNGLKIPRVRNWYKKGTNEYLGTDVIVKELD